LRDRLQRTDRAGESRAALARKKVSGEEGPKKSRARRRGVQILRKPELPILIYLTSKLCSLTGSVVWALQAPV
jgi:hypothetical protein